MRILAGNRVTPAPARFTMINGRPETIALKYPSGKRVTSRIPGAPDQAMYTLADGRRAYFPLEVGAQIDALHLAPGQPFSICKYGAREWDVQYAQTQSAAVPPPSLSPPTQQPPPQPDRDIPPHPWPQEMAPAAELFDTSKNSPAPFLGADSQQLLRCYAPAIEIALKAAETARGRGLMISPTFEDIRSIATVLFLGQGGRK